MTNPINRVPFLRTSRDFPEEIHQLATETNKTYVDIANAVNNRTIGIYPLNNSAFNGNSFFIANGRQQGLRQIYTFTGTSDINIGFKLSSITTINLMYGTYTNTSSGSIFGLIPATSVAIVGQISFYIAVNSSSTTSDVLKFVVDAGAPALNSGIIVLEWIANT